MNNVLRANVLILTPVGRDALACVKLVEQAGLSSRVCNTVADLITQLDREADVVVLAEEGLYGKALDPLEAWVGAQPPWSDMSKASARAFSTSRRSGWNSPMVTVSCLPLALFQ